MGTALSLKPHSIEGLKKRLGPKLIEADRITPPQGVPTTHTRLDQFLLWQGFPQGEVSLLYGDYGLGASHLWLKSAAQITQSGRWAAWINDRHTQLCPWALRKHQIHLSQFFYVQSPTKIENLLWALQEMISLSLFDLIGCDLGPYILRDQQIVKLKRLASRHKVALVFLRSQNLAFRSLHLSPFYALILRFQNQSLIVERALHRPTPYSLTRSKPYADIMSQLTPKREALSS